MKSIKLSHASSAQAEADRLLAELANAQYALALSKAQADRELSQTYQDWEKTLKPLRERVAELDRAVLSLAKEHQANFFAVDGLGSCSLDLPHGALLYDKTDYVVKPRKVDVLANLERYGFEEAIRRTAAVDWEVLANKEEWPDEVLAIIGTRREIKETFAYEISPSPQPAPLKGEGVKQEA
jgi:phage host-nuclease inhibitor protein Gam